MGFAYEDFRYPIDIAIVESERREERNRKKSKNFKLKNLHRNFCKKNKVL